jgi:hypothetical protein
MRNRIVVSFDAEAYSEQQLRAGVFTDTSVCVGCKDCEVACQERNMVPNNRFNRLGMSLDNTGALLMTSDVCKHWQTFWVSGSVPDGRFVLHRVGHSRRTAKHLQWLLVRVACLCGVIDRRERDGRAWNCTLCSGRHPCAAGHHRRDARGQSGHLYRVLAEQNDEAHSALASACPGVGDVERVGPRPRSGPLSRCLFVVLCLD